MEAFHKALMSPMARATPPAAIAVVLLLSTLAKMDLSKISGLLTIFKFLNNLPTTGGLAFFYI